jgi:hypothetical protein
MTKAEVLTKMLRELLTKKNGIDIKSLWHFCAHKGISYLARFLIESTSQDRTHGNIFKELA